MNVKKDKKEEKRDMRKVIDPETGARVPAYMLERKPKNKPVKEKGEES